MPPGHKIGCDPGCGPDMYSSDIIGSYIFLQDGWGWVTFCEDGQTSGGCRERNVSSYHQDAQLGESKLTSTYDAIHSRYRASAVTGNVEDDGTRNIC